MQFPEDLAAAVREQCSEDRGIMEALANGQNTMLGQYLQEISHGDNLGPQAVIDYIDRGDIVQLKALASRLIVLQRLFNQWNSFNRTIQF